VTEHKQTEHKQSVSIIIPVSERYDDIVPLYEAYQQALDDYEPEFVYVLDGDFPDSMQALKELKARGEPVSIVKLARCFGEATALTAGFKQTGGDIIVTLPAYEQVVPAEIEKVLAEILRGQTDLVVGRRWPRIDTWINRLQAAVFNSFSRLMVGRQFNDLGCSVRAMKRQVLEEVPLYGDQHRFLPILADKQGFRMVEVNVQQSPRDAFRRVYAPGVYVRRLLDLFTVFFLTKFTKKPLRFFGLVGALLLVAGFLTIIYPVIERMFFGVALMDRPVILLGSLMLLLGVQVLAIGLVGEIIIFTHASELREYTVEEIIN
jgi:glycosyltransferase involved in cell wall biosynthesis